MESTAITISMAEKRNRSIENTLQEVGGRLRGFIRNRINNEEEAEDIFQDVLFQFVQGFDQIRAAESTTSWLFRVARNKIIDRYRRRKFDALPLQADNGSEEGLSLKDILPDLSSVPDQELWQQMVRETMEEALAEMPENQRDVFIWHELEGKSFQEIADETGEKLNTLLSRKHYAILFLRDRLNDLYEELMD